MQTYNELCLKHGTDKGNDFPNGNDYANFYEKWFAPIRNEVRNICEIGIHQGASLRTNIEYFPNANVIGLDISSKTEHETDRIKTKVLDQNRPDQLNAFYEECRSQNLQFDIIIDDGSHHVTHQQMTFGLLFPLVKPGGIYIIEDLGSSYLCLGGTVYGYPQTQLDINNNTVLFLQQRPFSSPWIEATRTQYINEQVRCVTIFDKLNPNCTYLNAFKCLNDYPMRAITSIIEKKPSI